MGYVIRQASAMDSDEIRGIYAHYVLNTVASFETGVPSSDQFLKRVSGIIAQYPFPVCVLNGKILGYAYASHHREREAYRYNVETSIYVHKDSKSQGIGTALYRCLFAILAAQGYYNAYAGIVLPNEKSLRFHQKSGFAPVGTYHKTGYKFSQWHDIHWMEKALTPLDKMPGAIRAIGELPTECLSGIFNRFIPCHFSGQSGVS